MVYFTHIIKSKKISCSPYECWRTHRGLPGSAKPSNRKIFTATNGKYIPLIVCGKDVKGLKVFCACIFRTKHFQAFLLFYIEVLFMYEEMTTVYTEKGVINILHQITLGDLLISTLLFLILTILVIKSVIRR